MHTPLLRFLVAAAAVFASVLTGAQTSPPRDLVARIQRADYEGDRAALRTLRAELRVPAGDPWLASRLHYWRGFAAWRRAINGFNDSVDPKELEADLEQAVGDFEESLKQDAAFVDAKIAIASCLGYITFLHNGEPERVKQLVSRFVPLLREALAAAPDNPRVAWVYGPTLWYATPGLSPDQIQERRAKAIATYQRGLALARKAKGRAADPLEPSWGEPELLMNLAWSRLNGTPPDAAAAEAHAREALALVPHWRYVRDILIPQIRDAMKK